MGVWVREIVLRIRDTNEKNMNMKKLFLMLLAVVAVAACGEPEPTGPNWGPAPTPTPTPTPDPDTPKEIIVRNVEPTTELGIKGEDVDGLRFYPGISINIASSNWEKNLAEIAGAGFKYIEITIKHEFGIKDMTDEAVLNIFATKLNYVKSVGLTVWSIHLPFEDANWTNIAGKETVRVQSVANIMRVLRLCVKGFPECKNYVLHPSKGVLSPRTESVAQARKSLGEMIPEAKALGVRLCVENLVGSLCYSIEELENTIAGISDAWVTYDIGHANCKGIDVVKFLEAIGPRLGTVHMHDTVTGSGNDTHDYLGVPQPGINKWEDVYRTMLEDNRYRGVFLFELSGKSAATVMSSYNKLVNDYQKKYEMK